MNTRFTELIDDFRIFFADLLSFFNPVTAVASFCGCWDEIRHDRELKRTPLLLTAAIHIGTILFAIIGPMIIRTSPTIPEVYMVELYQVMEEAPAVQKVVVKQQVNTPPPKVEPVPVAKTAAVSLNPLKKKLIQEKEVREKEKQRQEMLQNRMEQIKLDFSKQQAEKDARKAANTAVERISDLYRKEKIYSEAQSLSSRTIQATPDATPADSGNSAREMEALDRYKAQLVQHIDKFWQLPELKDWKEDLECVMVIKVNRDGTLISSYFQKRSPDQRFNQYVKKAVENSIPLPPFPLDLPQQNDEIHVTFYPGGLL